MNREGILYCAAGVVGVGAVAAGIYLLKRKFKPSSKVALHRGAPIVYNLIYYCVPAIFLLVSNVLYCCIESL